MIAWLAFTPSYTAPRRGGMKRLGAHAFRPERPRSLCGYVSRAKAGGPADESARRCTWCRRVEDGLSVDHSADGRGWPEQEGATT